MVVIDSLFQAYRIPGNQKNNLDPTLRDVPRLYRVGPYAGKVLPCICWHRDVRVLTCITRTIGISLGQIKTCQRQDK